MRIGFVSMLICLGYNIAAAGPSASSPTSQSELQAVQIAVVDRRTEQPIPAFRYRYAVDVAGGGHESQRWHEKWTEVRQADGKFMLTLPAPSKLIICIQAPGYINGHGVGGSITYFIGSAESSIRIIHEMDRGLIVRGLVKDAQSGKPIPGAKIAPTIDCHPLFVPDTERTAATDEHGRFEVQGVDRDLGIYAEHADYERKRIWFDEFRARIRDGSDTVDLDVLLNMGPIIRGTVCDPSGRPLATANIMDGAGKRVISDADGKFELKSPAAHNHGGSPSFRLEVTKEGYDRTSVTFSATQPDDFRVVLKPQFEIRGLVRDDTGQPVTRFTILAGAGKDLHWFHPAESSIENDHGQFRVAVENRWNNGVYWIGIRANGFAPWEKRIVPTTAPEDLAVQLERGASLSGRILDPRGKGKDIIVYVVPSREKSDGSLVTDGNVLWRLAAWQCSPAIPGEFQFNNLWPETYGLYVYGKGITPIVRKVKVPPAGLKLDDIVLQGTGVVQGKIGPLRDVIPAFARGEIYMHRYDYPCSAYLVASGRPTSARDYVISFTADEHGTFMVPEVPIGPAKIRIPFHILTDVVDAHVREIMVEEGKTTRVDFATEEQQGNPTK